MKTVTMNKNCGAYLERAGKRKKKYSVLVTDENNIVVIECANVKRAEDLQKAIMLCNKE